MKRLIVCADDFGLDTSVNQAVERAHRDGILTCASLMVGESAAADAVERAKRLPRLGVGLHVVVVDGRPVLPPAAIPDLVDRHGRLDDRLFSRGVRYFFLPQVRAQLRREIEAQFEAFGKTGLELDHANGHRHLHLHPTVASMVLDIGRRYGLRALRIPLEPRAVLRAAGGAPGTGAALVDLWARRLRRRARAGGIAVNDHLLGLAWTGAMTPARMLRLLRHLPEGVSEFYAHPRDGSMELAALIDPAVRRAAGDAGAQLVRYGGIAP